MSTKKYFVIIIILCIAVCIPTQSKAIDIEKTAMFGAGIVSGIYWHELGHAAAIWGSGGTVDQIGFAYTSGSCSSQAINTVAMGGYTFEAIASEVILENKDWHQNDYALGWMMMGIWTNLSNPIGYYMGGDTTNDLAVYAQNGGDPAIPSILMVVHSAYSIYRICNETQIIPYLESTFLGTPLPQPAQFTQLPSTNYQIIPYFNKNETGIMIVFE